MKGQRKKDSYIWPKDATPEGKPTGHCLYDIKVTANPIEQCSRYAQPSKSIMLVEYDVWIHYIAEVREDLQELELHLRCKERKRIEKP